MLKPVLKQLYYISILLIFISALAGCNANNSGASTEYTPTHALSSKLNSSDIKLSTAITQNAAGSQYIYVNGAGVAEHNGKSISPKIFTYRVDANTGQLKLVDTIVTPQYSQFLKVSPDNKNLYLTHRGGSGDGVLTYQINPQDGTLILLGDTATGNNPQQIVITPNGKFAYVSNGGDSPGSVSLYNRDEYGMLTQLFSMPELSMPISDLPINEAPFSMSIDVDGKFLHVASFTACCTVDDPTNVEDLITFKIEADGSLLYQSKTIGGNGIDSSRISPNGQLLYTTSAYGVDGMTDSFNLITYKVENNGSLTQIAKTNDEYSPSGIKISPDSKFLYTLAYNEESSIINSFSIDLLTGNLTNITTNPLTYTNDGIGMEINPNGKSLYVIGLITPTSTHINGLEKYDRSIATYQITSTGQLISPDLNTLSADIVYIRDVGPVKSIAIATVGGALPILTEPTADQLNNVAVTTTFKLLFPEAIDATSLNDKTIQILLDDETIESPAQPIALHYAVESLTSNIIDITSLEPLSPGATYILKESNVLSVGGKLEASFTVKFHTENPSNVDGYILEPSNTSNASVNTIIRVEYPYLIESSSINANNIYVTLKDDVTHIPWVITNYTAGSINSVINFISNVNYTNGKNYTMHIQSLASIDKSVQNINKAFDFTANSTPDLIIYEAANSGAGYTGTLNGLSGADNICNTSPNKPSVIQCNGSCTFKALLGLQNTISGRYGCALINGSIQCGDTSNLNWVLMRNQRYINSSGALIGVTDNNGLLPVTTTNYIETDSGVTVPATAHQVWSGLNNEWRGLDSDNTCNGWVSYDYNKTGVYGLGNKLDIDSILQRGSGNCSQYRAIYCVEQPLQDDMKWWNQSSPAN